MRVVKHSSVDLSMKIIETTIFTRQISELVVDEQKQKLLDELIIEPNAGNVIKGSGGLRKLRWSAHGRGKSGGIRVIYYWCEERVMYLLLAYPKNTKDDLSARELSILREVVEKEKETWTKNFSAI
jgi:hypothetical protein